MGIAAEGHWGKERQFSVLNIPGYPTVLKWVDRLSNREITSLIKADAKGVNERIDTYFKELLEADEVIYAIICCDSRVVLPKGVHKVNWKKRIYCPIPVIGGGIPSKNTLLSILRTHRHAGVPIEKMSIVDIQHGSTEEIAHALPNGEGDQGGCDATCGARRHFGHAHGLLGKRLESILRSSDIRKNGEGVCSEICEILADTEFKRLQVTSAFMDHNLKILHSVSDRLRLPKVKPWGEPGQNPRIGTSRIGEKASATHDTVCLPHLSSDRDSNNFNSVASGDIQDIRDCLTDMSYLLSHKIESMSAGEGDFLDTEALIIIVDDQKLARVVINILKEPEMRQIVQEGIEALGGVRIVILDGNSDIDLSISKKHKERVIHWNYRID